MLQWMWENRYISHMFTSGFFDHIWSFLLLVSKETSYFPLWLHCFPFFPMFTRVLVSVPPPRHQSNALSLTYTATPLLFPPEKPSHRHLHSHFQVDNYFSLIIIRIHVYTYMLPIIAWSVCIMLLICMCSGLTIC